MTAAPGDVRVRLARAEDAAALAHVHVAAWRGAYRGQMPDEYLDALDPVRWTAGWERLLARTEQDGVLVLVAESDGAVVGFANAGPCRDEGSDGLGELYAINVHPDAWSRGAGPALLAAATQRLSGLGVDRAVLWVLPGNARARRFYERHGWSADGAARTAEVNGVQVDEVRYSRGLTSG